MHYMNYMDERILRPDHYTHMWFIPNFGSAQLTTISLYAVCSFTWTEISMNAYVFGKQCSTSTFACDGQGVCIFLALL